MNLIKIIIMHKYNIFNLLVTLAILIIQRILIRLKKIEKIRLQLKKIKNLEGTIKTLESKLTIKELKIDNLNTKIEGLELTNKQSKDESENTI